MNKFDFIIAFSAIIEIVKINKEVNRQIICYLTTIENYLPRLVFHEQIVFLRRRVNIIRECVQSFITLVIITQHKHSVLSYRTSKYYRA